MRKKNKLGKMKVSDLRHLLIQKPTIISPDASIDELLKKMIEDPRTRHVYVVDSQMRLIGSVRLNRIIEYLFPFAALIEQGSQLFEKGIVLGAEKTVKDLMNCEPFSVEESTSLSEMAKILIREKINELPVVDQEGKILGEINVYEVVYGYLSINEE
jgi:CBS domain-containing protein